MRRYLLVTGLIAVALAVVCAVALYASSQVPTELVPAGAQQVSVQRLGIGHQRISYRMPAGTTMSNLRIALHNQGWRRLRNVDEDLGVQFYSRSLFDRNLRIILTVRRPATSRDLVTLDVAQCFRLGDRMLCL